LRTALYRPGTPGSAFRRFGKPIDPRTGEPLDKTVRMADAAERVITIVTAVVEGSGKRALSGQAR
jgi:hypothetical protein